MTHKTFNFILMIPYFDILLRKQKSENIYEYIILYLKKSRLQIINLCKYNNENIILLSAPVTKQIITIST